MKENSLGKILTKCSYVLFAIAFGYISLNILFADKIHSYKIVQLLPGMMVGGVVVAIGMFILSKIVQEKIDRHFKKVLIVFSIVYYIVLIRMGFLLRFTPSFDMDAIYSGAIQWTNEGNFSNFYEYFGYFPNNLGSMGFLHIVFKIASLFGVKDFFAVGIIVNSALITGTAVIVALICKKIAGSKTALMSLILVLLCFPFYFMGAVFYTDSLSLMFPVLFYYLYLCLKGEKDRKKQIIYLAAMGLSLTIGMMIKFTVVIVLIAVAIDAFLYIPWKKTLLIVAVSLAFYGGIVSIYNHNIYKNYISDEQYQNLKTPYWHWIMMGLQNNGCYNPADYEYTRSYDVNERSAACRKKAMERVKELGVSGLLKLWTNKALIGFGDGTYALSALLDDMPVNDTVIHDYILYDGKNYSKYQQFSTGLLIVLYLLAIVGSVRDIIGKVKYRESILPTAPRLAMLGILCFLMLWEITGRYFTNYIPMLIVCASLTLYWKKEKVRGENLAIEEVSTTTRKGEMTDERE